MDEQDRANREVATSGGHPVAGRPLRGELRVSHADRDAVAEEFRVAAGDGRLTADELDERLERALTARTYDELAVLTVDLPAAGTPVAGAVAGIPPAPPKELLKIHLTSGNSAKLGRWTVPARMDLKVTSGNIRLDFTDAVITAPTLHIDAAVKSGNVTLLIRPGIAVDLDDVAVRSGNIRVREPWGDVPVFLRITVAGTCGSGNIIARPPRRSFWEWLRRAPRRYAITA
jgi:hypothetical protein